MKNNINAHLQQTQLLNTNILPARILFGLFIASFLLFSVFAGHSFAEDDESWDVQTIDYPSTMMMDPDGSKAEKIMLDWKATTEARKEKKSKWKKRLLPFSKDKEHIPTEDEIVEVGPREHAAVKDPVFPLPKTLLTSDGKIMPGFYQVRELRTSGDIKTLGLLKQNQPVMTVDVFLESTQTGPAEKIKGTEDMTPTAHVSSEDGNDQQSLILIYRVGDTTYKSNALRVVTDNRQILK